MVSKILQKNHQGQRSVAMHVKRTKTRPVDKVWKELDQIPELVEGQKLTEAITKLAGLQINKIQSPPQKQLAYLWLGICYQAQGKLSLAKQQYKQVKSLETKEGYYTRIVNTLNPLDKTTVNKLLETCGSIYEQELKQLSI